MDGVIETIREMEKSLRISVKIPRDEVDRVVVNRLIKIRNSEVNRNEDMSHIDKTIRFFLSEDEFQKHVIEKVEIEF